MFSAPAAAWAGDAQLDVLAVAAAESGRMKTLDRYVLGKVAGRFTLLLLVFVGVVVGGNLGSFIGRGAPPEALLLGNTSQAYVVGLREAVDSGKSMTDFLAQAFHAQRHTIRFLVGKSPAEVGRRWSGSPARLIALLDSLPPELRPAQADAWGVINCLVAAAEERTLRQVSRAIATASSSVS